MARFINDGCPGPTPTEQATRLIALVGDEVSRSGEPLKQLPNRLHTLIGAPNPNAAGKLALELKARAILNGIDASGDTSNLFEVDLTLDGWERYAEEKRGKIAGDYGFIAMQFNDEELDHFVHTTIRPAVKEELGYPIVDMRDVARAGIIDNIMRAQIRDSAFVLSDLTHDNSGAYWEAGYAEGLHKPVIYLCEKSKFERLRTHFDTNHSTTITWSVDEEKRAADDLIATLRRSLNLFSED